MPTAETKVRPCAVCHRDCTGSSYKKDRKGRYFHEECLHRLNRQRAAKAAVAKVEDPGIIDAVVTSALQDVPVACPKCQAPNRPDARICMRCGYDRELGRSLNTKVVKAPKEKKERGTGFTLSPMAVIALTFLIPSGLLLAASAQQSLILVGMTALLLQVFATNLWTLIATFRDSVMQGVLCMFVPFYVAFWMFTRNESPYLQAAWIGTVGAQFAFVFLSVGGIIRFEESGEAVAFLTSWPISPIEAVAPELVSVG